VLRNQVFVAHRLARAYGHAWACNLSAQEAVELLSNGRVPEDGDWRNIVDWPARRQAIETLSRIRSVERDPWTVWGLHYPQTDKYGNVTHRTGNGSGRLSWAVAWDGSVHATLYRPAGAAARGAVYPDGQIDFWHVPGGPTIHQRHIWSLVELVRAATDRSMWSVWRELTWLLEPLP